MLVAIYKALIPGSAQAHISLHRGALHLETLLPALLLICAGWETASQTIPTRSQAFQAQDHQTQKTA